MGKRIGIYGGGQLGLYLCRAARTLGLETTVLTEDAASPACAGADRVLEGALGDLALARRLVNGTDLITFEIEAVPASVLAYLAEAEERGEVEVAPGAAIMLLLQDKARQKRWMAEHGLPTASFQILDGGRPDGARLAASFGLPLVQKLQRGGYDGRGVQVIRDETELSRLWSAPSVIERFLPAVQEIAVLVARGRDGSVRTYAPVGLRFNAQQNVLETLVAPAGIERSTARRARRIARRAIQTLGGVGLFAVEMFLCEDGRVLINEISPRVHNAGHHTIEACATSQFEQHLRAITGLPLGDVTHRGVAVTRNLLWNPMLRGMEGLGAVALTGRRRLTALHWYGKREARPWRKMGHITCLGPEPEVAMRRSEMLLGALSAPAGEARP